MPGSSTTGPRSTRWPARSAPSTLWRAPRTPASSAGGWTGGCTTAAAPRSSGRSTAVTPGTDARQVSLLPPDVAETLHLVRENLRLLAGLTSHYEVARLASGAGRLSVRRPDDIAAYLGPEMADLDQAQLRVVLLDTRNAVLGIHLVFQGGLNATVIRLADCFREAVRANAAAII